MHDILAYFDTVPTYVRTIILISGISLFLILEAGIPLFKFDYKAKHGIWMKNMHFPIDIYFLDFHYKILEVKRNVPPCTETPCTVYYPQFKTYKILETNVGEFSINKGRFRFVD